MIQHIKNIKKIRKDRKGVELTFDAIVIAALVLIVLVVIILIVTGQFAKIVPQLALFTSCDGRGGVCKPDCDPGETGIPKLGECGEDGREDKCCIPRG